MSDRTPVRRAENYTLPFLVTLGALFFMALWTIWAVAGLLWAIIGAVTFDRVIAAIPKPPDR